MCTVDADCQSDHCKVQGSGATDGGASAGSYCTVFCATPRSTSAPECAGPIFTGKCGGDSFCQVK
jgi:hypothetical protein